MSLRCRSAVAITGNCIKLATKRCGGKISKSIHCQLPKNCGNKPIQSQPPILQINRMICEQRLETQVRLMSTLKQIEANRLNALKSTGPKTPEGKRHSRCNAIRHGLTAETVIVGFEDADDYGAFEATVIADYDAQSAVERELVLRLASVLWRLRRATGIETSLLESVIEQSRQSELLLSRLFLDSEN